MIRLLLLAIVIAAITTKPPTCSSGWFDTHVHYNNPNFVDEVMTGMRNYDVSCSVLLDFDAPFSSWTNRAGRYRAGSIS